MSEPQLRLVWINEELLAVDDNRAARRRLAKATGQPWWEGLRRVGRWLKRNGTAVTTALAILVLVWYGSKLDSRLENIERAFNGDQGLIASVQKLNADV